MNKNKIDKGECMITDDLETAICNTGDGIEEVDIGDIDNDNF